MTIDNLPKTKWITAGNQVILKSDFTDIEQAILDTIGYVSPPPLSWATAATIKVLANAGSPARLLLSGFPDALHPGQFVNPTGSAGTWREDTVDETLDISSGACRWGTEQASTWYAVLAVAPTGSGFDLKVMPYMRVKADAANKITTRNNAHNADLDYGFADDDLVNGYVYVISGTKKGYLALINSNDATGGYTNIDYDGDPLGLSAGDWFIVLPVADYRWLGDVFNNSSSNLLEFKQDGHVFRWAANQTITASGAGMMADYRVAPPLATMALIKGTGGNAEDYAGHPTLTNQQVLMSQFVSADVSEALTSLRTFTPGFQPVPIDTCAYYMTSAGTFYSGGYGYPAGYLD